MIYYEVCKVFMNANNFSSVNYLSYNWYFNIMSNYLLEIIMVMISGNQRLYKSLMSTNVM